MRVERIAALLVLPCALAIGQAASRNTEGTAMSRVAQEYVKAFERGDDFAPPARGVLVDGQPDAAALAVLGGALEVGSPQVRDNVVKLLVEIGRAVDPLTAKGADVLRDPTLIALLAGPGLAKPDLGRETAMEFLRKLVPPAQLAPVAASLVRTLAAGPTEEALLLVAKAKPAAARAVVERLMKEPRWQNLRTSRIALAALGSRSDEDALLAAADAATTGTALADAVGPLGLMGTPRSLKKLGELLRTPLTVDVSGHMPGRSVKSVRLDVLKALLYNFPEQPALYPNNINEDRDYRTAEQFCAAALGILYKDPPPPYLKYGNVPPEPVPR